jgi:flagellar basal-body rod modification protein FlgD
MNSFAATYGIPTTLHTYSPSLGGGPAKATGTKANATAASSSASSSSTSSSSSGDGVGSTFLSLLAEELQNQDPTSPVDSTAMVGQMISLSELGQLISINSALTSATSTTSTTSQVSKAAADNAALTSANSGIANTLSPSTAGAATSQLPFDPNTMMPWNFGNASAASASISPVLNTSTLGQSGANNNATGGK